MSINTTAVGYNWVGQRFSQPQSVELDKSAIIGANTHKAADCMPLISLVSGPMRVVSSTIELILLCVTEKHILKKGETLLDRKIDLAFNIVRGVMATLQLGLILLVADIFMTIVNGILSHKANKAEAEKLINSDDESSRKPLPHFEPEEIQILDLVEDAFNPGVEPEDFDLTRPIYIK